MRVIRSNGQNVSPSDDANLFEEIFSDGIFGDASITSLGSNQVSISALYGIMQGRDFTSEAQTLNVELASADEATGYVYVQFDVSGDEVISFGSALAPWTPTYEDINGTGTICQMVLAEYTTNPVQVTSITEKFEVAETGGGHTDIEVTLASGAWENALYTIQDSRLKLNHTWFLTYPPTLTDDQYEQLASASIRISAQTEGSLTLRALGTVPTSSIPIIIVVGG